VIDMSDDRNIAQIHGVHRGEMKAGRARSGAPSCGALI
jgi:hypothetical protein